MKTTLTTKVTARILAEVRAGVPAPQAAAACGRSWNTVKSWIARGRAAEVDVEGEAIDPKDAPFVRFAVRFEIARAQAVSIRVKRISKAAKSDAKLDQWWLEKRTAAFRPRAPKRDNPDDLPPLPSGDSGTRTILVYPVPVPHGADPRTYALPEGHAFENVNIIDTDSDEGDGDAR